MDSRPSLIFFVDSHAANIVLRSGAPVTLVPLDATNQVPINRYMYRALEGHHNTPAAQVLYDLFSATPNLYAGGSYFWDPLAAALSVDSSLARLETLRIRVVEEGGPDIGRTVVANDGAPVQVALSADAERFEAEFLSRLNDGAPVTIDRALSASKAKLAVTQTGDTCTYSGPTTVAAGEVGIDWTIDTAHEGYGLALVTLDEDRSFADLKAWPSADRPPWVQEVTFLEGEPGSRSTASVNVEKGPVYIVCFTAFPLTKAGTLGPIEVTR